MQRPKIERYVAIGDSLTEGIWDWGQGDRRAGFAYLLADQLRQQYPALQFDNLGSGGARTGDVLRFQVDRALRLKPQLLTLVVGANDVPGTPTPQFRREFGDLVERLHTGMDGMIVLANLPNVEHLLPVQYASYRAALVSRVAEFNAIIGDVATAHDLPLVDLHSNAASADHRNISGDGLHPNPRGYRLMADAFAQALRDRFGLLETQNNEHSTEA